MGSCFGCSSHEADTTCYEETNCEFDQNFEKCETFSCPRKPFIHQSDGLTAIIIGFISFVLFIGAITLVSVYQIKYHKGIKWREYDTVENKEQSTNLHAILTVLGMITLSGFGLTMYSVCPCCPKDSMLALHIFLQILAGVATALGIYLIYDLHDYEKQKHFYSIHGWVGLIAAGLFAVELVFGFLKFICLLACGPVFCCLRACCIPIHGAIGLSAYWSGVIAIVIAIQREIVKESVPRRRYFAYSWFESVVNYIKGIVGKDYENKLVQYPIPTIKVRRKKFNLDPFKPTSRISIRNARTEASDKNEFWIRPTRRPSKKPTTKKPISTSTLKSPPHYPELPPVFPGTGDLNEMQLQDEENKHIPFNRIHTANGFTVIAVLCGLLVTYSVISRLWKKRQMFSTNRML